MKKTSVSVLTVLLTIVCALPLLLFPAASASTPRRQTDVTSAGEDMALTVIRGTFSTLPTETILQRLNEIRREACEEGVPNPATGKPLTIADYTPLRWSSQLEWIAQTRAAEASLVKGHTRPNGTSCFTCTHQGLRSWSEDLAWNASGILSGIEQWYREKSNWVRQNENAVTGHYTSLIAPDNCWVGIGCFRLETGGWYAVAGELSSGGAHAEEAIGVSGLWEQVIEVPASELEAYQSYAGQRDGEAGCTHSLVKTPAVPPTCGQPGSIAYWTCSRCGKLYADAEGETPVSKEATVLPAAGTHRWDKGAVTRAASVTAAGVRTYTCTVCGATWTQAIPKLRCTITASDLVRGYSAKVQRFRLKAKAEGGAALRYRSGSKKVRVDQTGRVTLPAGFSGRVKITITAAAARSSRTITITVPTAPVLTKATGGKGQLAVQWKRNTTGNGYQLQYGTSKRFKGAPTVKLKNNTTVKRSVKGLKKGTYYVRIRTMNGKCFSNWSKVRTLKVS